MCECRRGSPPVRVFSAFRLDHTTEWTLQQSPVRLVEDFWRVWTQKNGFFVVFSRITMAGSATCSWNRPSIPKGLNHSAQGWPDSRGPTLGNCIEWHNPEGVAYQVIRKHRADASKFRGRDVALRRPVGAARRPYQFMPKFRSLIFNRLQQFRCVCPVRKQIQPFQGCALLVNSLRVARSSQPWAKSCNPFGIVRAYENAANIGLYSTENSEPKNETFFAARTALTLTGNLHDVDFPPVTTVLELAKKSCLNTYRRFFVLPGLCQNERMNMKNSSTRNGERAPRYAQGCPQSRPAPANTVKPGQGLTRLNKAKQA